MDAKYSNFDGIFKMLDFLRSSHLYSGKKDTTGIEESVLIREVSSFSEGEMCGLS